MLHGKGAPDSLIARAVAPMGSAGKTVTNATATREAVMSQPVINNVASTDTFQEVVFTVPRSGFSVVVSNKAIAYQLALPGASGSSQDAVWESLIHQLNPSFSNFSDPAMEGYPGVGLFAGFRFKSWITGISAVVSVN